MTLTEDDIVAEVLRLQQYLGRKPNREAAQAFFIFTGRDKPTFQRAVRNWQHVHGPSSSMPSAREMQTAMMDIRAALPGNRPVQMPDFENLATTKYAEGVTAAMKELPTLGLLRYAQRLRELAEEHHPELVKNAREIEVFIEHEGRWPGVAPRRKRVA